MRFPLQSARKFDRNGSLRQRGAIHRPCHFYTIEISLPSGWNVRVKPAICQVFDSLKEAPTGLAGVGARSSATAELLGSA